MLSAGVGGGGIFFADKIMVRLAPSSASNIYASKIINDVQNFDTMAVEIDITHTIHGRYGNVMLSYQVFESL